MAKIIYKYVLNSHDITILEMPIDAEILTVQYQFGSVCIWALVDYTNENESRLFGVIPTGQLFNEKEIRKYLGTVQENGGQFIWHVFELNKNEFEKSEKY